MKKIFVFIITTFFFACTFKPPELSTVHLKRLRIETEHSGLVERLSVFFKYEDNDGKNDYGFITVAYLKDNMVWTIDKNDTSFFISAGTKISETKTEFYAGSNKLTHPFGFFPAGDYKITVEDSAGNRTDSTITFENESGSMELPFDFQVNQTQWEIVPKDILNYPHYSLILLGADRQPIIVLNINEGDRLSGALTDLKNTYNNARYVQCYAENKKNTGYVSKPYLLY